MEAKRVEAIPSGGRWQYEPKWDGFRAIVFRHDDELYIQSKAGQPLARYFPELVEAFLALDQKTFVLDGEIVISIAGSLSFDDLQLRLHPAKSRVDKLSRETPSQYFAFDLLYRPVAGLRGKVIHDLPLQDRREELEKFFESIPAVSSIKLSPATIERSAAVEWFENYGSMGLDGIIAKLLDEPYHSGDRDGMVKVKHMKEADCVVGGFRYGTGSKDISTLLLGLYDDEGVLHHIGHCSSLNEKDRKEVTRKLLPLAGRGGFTGSAPGGPSRWSTERSGEWTPVEPTLVCEVRYDYYSQGRFRHGSKFLRWRPDKDPASCTYEQVSTKRKR